MERLLLLYEELFNKEFDKETIFNEIINGKYTVAPAIKGENYICGKGLMVVGRAVNGWKHNFKSSDAKDLVNEMFNSKNMDALCDVVNPRGVPDIAKEIHDGNLIYKKYYYKKSRFWKLVKCLISYYIENKQQDEENFDHWYVEGDFTMTNSECANYDAWRDKQKDKLKTGWSQSIVWSNLCKVSPYCGGNPNKAMVDAQMEICIKILKAEIEMYMPKAIVFILGNWHLEQLKEEFGIKCEASCENILFKGHYNRIPYVICKRPDAWGKGDSYAKEIGKDITEELHRLTNTDK